MSTLQRLQEADQLISQMSTVIMNEKCADHIPIGLTDRVKEWLQTLPRDPARDENGSRIQHPIKTWVETVARMKTEEEQEDGGSVEDFVETLNRLISEARELTGVDPRHERLYCSTCGTSSDDCECDADGPDILEIAKGAIEDAD